MIKRGAMLVGGILGAIWAVIVVWVPGQFPQPFIPINLALIYAFVPGGVVVLLWSCGSPVVALSVTISLMVRRLSQGQVRTSISVS